LNAAFVGGGATGSSTAAIAFGGLSPKALTEDWNGTSWTEIADLATARDNRIGGSGTSIAGLAFGGGSASNATEEFTGAAGNLDVTLS